MGLADSVEPLTEELSEKLLADCMYRLYELDTDNTSMVVSMKVFRWLDRIANPWKISRANWLRRKR